MPKQNFKLKLKNNNFLKSLFTNLTFFALVFKPVNVFAQDIIDTSPDRIVITTDIDSTVEDVWQVMIDFRNYETWNTWYRLEGEAKEGATLKAYAQSGSHLDLQITKIANPTLCWTDVSWFTHFGLGGWRCRSVAANPDGRGVRFINHFEYSGPLRFILEFGTSKTVLDGMTLENQNLKTFLEKRKMENTFR
jgi:hypothetical protein